MPMRVLIARMLLLTWVALYVAYLLGASDPAGVGAITSTLVDRLARHFN
jgi:hypothetical protein